MFLYLRRFTNPNMLNYTYMEYLGFRKYTEYHALQQIVILLNIWSDEVIRRLLDEWLLLIVNNLATILMIP